MLADNWTLFICRIMQLFHLIGRKTCTKRMAKKRGIEEILILLWWLPNFFSAGEGTCFFILMECTSLPPFPCVVSTFGTRTHRREGVTALGAVLGSAGGWRSNTKIHKSMISRSRFWSQPKCDAAVLQDACKSCHAFASGWVCSTKIW